MHVQKKAGFFFQIVIFEKEMVARLLIHKIIKTSKSKINNKFSKL